MVDLHRVSINVLKQNQAPSGAFLACPNYPSYQYSWLRDGTFIAYALDCVGEHDAARRFYQWVNGVIGRNRDKLLSLKRKVESTALLTAADFLPTRYRLDGSDSQDDWPNFQLDGYGTWLWGLAEHAALTGKLDLLADYQESIDLTLEYLKLCWQLPNFDCWEEHGNQIHTSTLACLSGGVKRLAALTKNQEADSLANEIREYLLHYGVTGGRLTKFCRKPSDTRQVVLPDVRANSPIAVGDTVDASLLWAALPFGVLDALEPTMLRTVQEIRRRLFKDGGVHRYPLDTYYGGGQWTLLSAWLGWYDCRAGNLAEAMVILTWLERQADAAGLLPEQVETDLIEAESYQPWVDRWGLIAKPLLWSHAMYLVLELELAKRQEEEAAACISETPNGSI